MLRSTYGVISSTPYPATLSTLLSILFNAVILRESCTYACSKIVRDIIVKSHFRPFSESTLQLDYCALLTVAIYLRYTGSTV